MVYEITDQGLWNAGIHAIHAHVVAIIGSPSQSQFREVAGTDNHSSHLICQVHQDLGTFTCLRIFIGYIMHAGIMTDVLEVLGYRLGDADFLDGDTEALHQ